MKPSKPAAALSAVIGVAMIVFALVGMHGSPGIRIGWCAIVVAIVGMQVWSAFSSRGSLYTAESNDPPRSLGSSAERER